MTERGSNQLCDGLKVDVDGTAQEALAVLAEMDVDKLNGLLVSDAENTFNSYLMVNMLWNVCYL